MKVSKYTFLFEENNEYYAYNTLSNALVEVDKDAFCVLLAATEKESILSAEHLGIELLNVLEKQNIITENDIDDFLKYKASIIRMRAQRNSMHLTIAPTMDCCFSCHYCFEKYKTKERMSPKTMDAIVKYVSLHKDLQSLHLTWFGGEPLMALSEIEMFYDKLKTQLNNIKFSSNIITT